MPCQRREMAVSTNNGLVNAPVHNLLAIMLAIMNLSVFFLILSRKSVSGSRLNRVCMGRSGTSAYAVYALFSHFCDVGGFGDLGDPVVSTLRGSSGDVVTVSAS